MNTNNSSLPALGHLLWERRLPAAAAPPEPGAIVSGMMHSKRILVPLHLTRGTTGTLLYLRQMAAESPCSVTLLHVVELDVVAPDSTLYPAICSEAANSLRQLAGHSFGHADAVGIRVRIGQAHEQIIAEAASSKSDLILLTSPQRRGWARWFRAGTVERIMESAPCPTLIVPNTRNFRTAGNHGANASVISRAPRLRPTWAGHFPG